MTEEDYFVSYNGLDESAEEQRMFADYTLFNGVIRFKFQKGAANGADNFPSILTTGQITNVNWVSLNYDGSSPYTVTADYVFSDGSPPQIDWSPGGNEPSVGAKYWVSANVTLTSSVTATDKQNHETFAASYSGFNTEDAFRDNEVKKYTSKTLQGQIQVDTIRIEPTNESTAAGGKVTDLKWKNTTTDRWTFFWITYWKTNKVYGDSNTGTSTNYAKYYLYSDGKAKLEYRDDFGWDLSSTKKWEIDEHDSSGVSQSASGTLIFAAGSDYIIYEFENVGTVIDGTIDVTAGTAANMDIAISTDGLNFTSLGNASAQRIFDTDNNLGAKFYIRLQASAANTVTNLTVVINSLNGIGMPFIDYGSNTIQVHLNDSPTANLACSFYLEWSPKSIRQVNDLLVKQVPSLLESSHRRSRFFDSAISQVETNANTNNIKEMINSIIYHLAEAKGTSNWYDAYSAPIKEFIYGGHTEYYQSSGTYMEISGMSVPLIISNYPANPILIKMSSDNPLAGGYTMALTLNGNAPDVITNVNINNTTMTSTRTTSNILYTTPAANYTSVLHGWLTMNQNPYSWNFDYVASFHIAGSESSTHQITRGTALFANHSDTTLTTLRFTGSVNWTFNTYARVVCWYIKDLLR